MRRAYLQETGSLLDVFLDHHLVEGLLKMGWLAVRVDQFSRNLKKIKINLEIRLTTNLKFRRKLWIPLILGLDTEANF